MLKDEQLRPYIQALSFPQQNFCNKIFEIAEIVKQHGQIVSQLSKDA